MFSESAGESLFEAQFRCGHSMHPAPRSGKPFPLPGTPRRWSRDRVVDVRHIKLEIALDFEEQTIAGTVTHTVVPILDGLESLDLDCVDLKVSRVSARGQRGVKFTQADGTLSVSFGRPLPAGRPVDIAIKYSGRPRRGLYFLGPDEHYPEKRVEAWTQGQDQDSRHWYPCYDYPNQKATTEVIATAPEAMQVLSNGRLVKATRNRSRKTRTWHWKQAIPHVTYLVTLVAGEYETWKSSWRGVPMTVYAPPGRLADAKRACAKTGRMMSLFSTKIGERYPYEKYDQVFVQDFIFGGMENTTATTLTDTAMLDRKAFVDTKMDSLVAHELAHQWWGDLVTCRDWSHGWLNEGFATYFDAVWQQHDLGEDEYRVWMLGLRDNYFAEDSGHYRRPIVCKTYRDPVEIFDRHLYDKGAVVLHMLRNMLGDDLWWRCIKRYVKRHKGGSVETVDLRRAIEDETGRNYEWFFDQWVFHGGHPALKATFSWNEKKKTATVTMKQTHTVDDLTRLFRMPLSFAFKVGRGTVTENVMLSERDHTWHFKLASRPKFVNIDPGFRVLKTLDFTPPRDMLVEQLRRDDDVVGRIFAAEGLGKDGSPEAVDALARSLRSSDMWAVRAASAKALGKVKTGSARDALLRALADDHSKVRRAAAAALGEFRGDERAGKAVAKVLVEGDESWMVEAECAKSVGRIRAKGALGVLLAVYDERDSWNEVVRCACLAGLANLRDKDAVPTARDATRLGNHNSVRALGAVALGRLAEVEGVSRTDIVDDLVALAEDWWLRVKITACGELGRLKEPKALAALSRLEASDLDGRVRRTAAEMATAIRKGTSHGDDLKKLRDEVEELRTELRKLRDEVRKA